MCFICNYKLFEVLDFKLVNFKENINPLLSSGVGKYISRYLYNKKYNMYSVLSSLVIHDGNDDSKMNMIIRNDNKLISRM